MRSFQFYTTRSHSSYLPALDRHRDLGGARKFPLLIKRAYLGHSFRVRAGMIICLSK